MDEYNCITVLSQPGEGQGEFASRLTQVWTRMLRQRKADFEKVYAETAQFEEAGGCWSRQYLVKTDAAGIVEAELRGAGIDFEPIDSEELFSKYEAVAPEWMQIEH